ACTGIGGVNDPTPWRVPGAKAAGLTSKSRLMPAGFQQGAHPGTSFRRSRPGRIIALSRLSPDSPCEPGRVLSGTNPPLATQHPGVSLERPSPRQSALMVYLGNILVRATYRRPRRSMTATAVNAPTMPPTTPASPLATRCDGGSPLVTPTGGV